MNTTHLKWAHEVRQVADLKPHPSNTIFSNLAEAELKELADDMALRGQQHPIDILPDGTIVGGENRWIAAKRNGWETIKCRVRYDLARAGEEAIEEFLLRDNFCRRQLTPLAAARVYRRLKALAKKTGRKIKGDIRDFIAQRFGKSGRTLDRWARLLDAPIEVQNAVSDGKLKLLDGCRVVDLPKEVQANIAHKIVGGQDPHRVVQGYIGKKKSAENVGTLLSQLLRALSTKAQPLAERVDEIAGEQWVASLPTLHDAQQLLQRLSDRIKMIAESSTNSDLVERYIAKGNEE